MRNFWLNLPKPFLILAPMEAVTDVVFREIVSEIAKPDVLFTEFTNTDGLVSKGEEVVKKSLKFTEKQKPIVAQIWGTKPENFYKSAQMIKDMGFDGIDINMGCPDKQIIKHGSCAALIENRPLASEIIKATQEGALGLPVSVKTRIGLNNVVTEDWAGFLLDHNLDALTIHGRTAKEMSKVPANWDEIQKVVNVRNHLHSKTLIIGNGDVKDRDDANEKTTTYGVDGVMIGRGIFQNPWVFEKIPKTHSISENLSLLLMHVRLYEETWGEKSHFDIMKKFFKMYIHGFSGADELRNNLMSCHNYQEVRSIVQESGLLND